MKSLEVHSLESAPPGSKPTLEKEKGAFGTVTNLTGIFAESPAVVEGVSALFGQLLQHGSLSPIEKQVVALAAARANDCHYCVAAHSTLAVAAKMDPVDLHALREGQPLASSKLETLRQFTLTLMKKQGWPSTEDLNSFYAAGFSRAQLLEVIAWIGLKVITNYTNHIAQTPVDSMFASQVWKTSKKAS